MKIGGLQKVSTIDYPGEICCVVFLWGCNFRCGFCHNPDLVVRDFDSGFSEEYVLDFLERRKGKLDGVCITGGEPLVSLDFGFVRKIKAMEFKVKLDTNGSFPGKLKELIDLGLIDYVAMDVKSCAEDYSKVAGVSVDVSKIEESIKIIDEFGAGEFRTTVVPGLHDEKSLVEMGKWMNEVCGRKPKKFFLQGFKRGEGVIDSFFNSKREVLEKELLEMKELLEPYFEKVDIRV